ncbi:nucleotidyl transferase [Mycobacterium phage EniyanLRS]|uniref:Nucleotidyl transferase n=1 Tax=Mycobacterium phage EniyanLRS TaxID=1933770 RepID=A0A2I2MPF7_9CAUD|nr:nucleotidyl transferase [Mycobacterium phage EniyanLRS]
MSDPTSSQIACEGLIYLAETGSTVMGTDLPTSDVDLKGVCIESPSVVFSPHKNFQSYRFRTGPSGNPIPEYAKTPPGSTEGTIYTLRSWARLACKGDFGAITMLWTPMDRVHSIDYPGTRLRGYRKMFITKQLAVSATGYLFSQKKRLEREYDPKAAYHAVRIGVQATELLTCGELYLPMTQTMRDLLLDIRCGRVALDAVKTYVDLSLDMLDKAVFETDVPDRVSEEEVTDLVTDMYLDFWKAKSWVR